MIIDGDKLEEIVSHINEPAYILVATPSGISCAMNNSCEELLPVEKNTLYAGINTCLLFSLIPPVEDDDISGILDA